MSDRTAGQSPARAFALACFFYGTYVVALVSAMFGHHGLAEYARFLYLPIYPLGALIAEFAARRQDDPADGPFWRALGLAGLLTWTGGVWWLLVDYGVLPPHWYVTDSITPFYYPVMVVALCRRAGVRWSTDTKVKFALDAGATMVAGGILSWYVVLAGLLPARQGAPNVPWALFYPAADLMLAVSAVSLLGRRELLRSRPSRAFLGSLVVMYVADTLYSAHNLNGTYVEGGWIDIGWATCAWLLAFAAYEASKGARLSRAELDVDETLRDGPSALPSLTAAIVFLVLVVAYLAREEQEVMLLVPWCALLTLLVIVRQLVAIRENARLVAERIQQEARYRALVVRSTDATVIVGDSGAITYASPSVLQVLGQESDEILGQTVHSLAHADDHAALETWFAGVATGQYATPTITWRVAGAGSPRYIEMSGVDLRSEPSIGGIVLHSRDVSDRVALEEQLRQAQKMEAVGQLAGGVAHDFNNILAAISMNGHLLEESAPEGCHEEISAIIAAAERGTTLTRQLLAFSRRETPRPERVQPLRAIASLHPLLHRLLPSEMSLEFSGDEDECVIMDRPSLDQVVMNLVLNARDAGATRVRLEVRSIGELVVVEVSDNGSGMPEHVRQRVFEPFFTTKDRGKGTGLGLATVYGIVERARGAIVVQSAPGAGTRFIITLPRAERHVVPTVVATSSTPSTVRDILIVDDEDAVRDVLRRALARHGYRLLEARDGQEALDILATARPALVISDIVMPRMDGVALVSAIRARYPDQPVLMMSGYAGQLDDAAREVVNRERFLAKPFQMAEMLAVVREMSAREMKLAS